MKTKMFLMKKNLIISIRKREICHDYQRKKQLPTDKEHKRARRATK
jgi:hypothetical protein